MARLLWFSIVLVTLHQAALAQPTFPVLPDEDYEVYSVVGNYFSRCDESSYVRQPNKLWLVHSQTEIQSGQNSWFKFNEMPKQLAWLFLEKKPFHKQADWWSFLASIDGSQFTRYELKKRLRFACQETLLWTNDKRAYYFGSENWAARGYEALRKDYPDFRSIIQFSKVAFSSDDTKAVCYYSEVSGSFSGEGFLVFLEKKDGKWGVMAKTSLWVS
ncbi:hypothetical protein J2I47_04010 [Fibrella sp. HMF5335]|uniref:Uncharacterized protein n=1 Tax=Fibrella rubiginis TaxID=2817060 RepID=A0A939GFD3_9BACT|nr:hypothetical protein [Fibrella rubiginis]MBO0935706.1 hypothetical protein [Fibrella rubiginis]